MKMRVLAAGLVMAIAGTAWAQEQPAKPATVKNAQPTKQDEKKKDQKMLNVGDKAPPLQIEKWVKGEPVTGFEKGRVYVVEFWATWCGPCVASMPHLTEVQKEYKNKGVTVIGVTSVDPNNTLEKVKEMVKEKGDEKMGYTVAWDKERKTNEAYLQAAEEYGIPCAFVINQEGVLAYIGHPMAMDEPLKEIVEGKYDLKAAAMKREEAKAKEREQMAVQRAAAKKMAPISDAMRAKEWDKASGLIDEMIKSEPDMARSLAMRKWQMYLMGAKDYDKAYAWANKAADTIFTTKGDDDAMMLNSIAWTILDTEGVEKRDYPTALRLAKKAVDFTDNKDGMIMDTLGLAYFKTGDVAKAVETQRKAIDLAKKDSRVDEDTLTEMKERLAKFEKAADEKK